MSAACRIAILAMLILAIFSVYGEELDKWEVADRKTARLLPTAFSDLPQIIEEDLMARGCLIPQIDWYEHPHNVIEGHFRNSSQTDWAVMCSINRRSTVLIYWGGSIESIEELPSFVSREDKDCLQGTGEGTVGYGCVISTADAKYIEDRARWYGGKLPNYLDHEGINVGMDGKASTVRYWFEGEWLALQGAD